MEPEQVEQCITESIWNEVYGAPRPKDDFVHVGCITHVCPRRDFYAVTVPVTFFDIRTTMNFWYGLLIHSRKLLPRSTLELLIEYEGVCGHVDEYSFKLNVGLEKKSTSTYPQYISPSHKLQAEYYFSILKKLRFRSRGFYVVYFLKSMDPILPQVYDIKARGTQFVIDEIMDKKNAVLNARDDEELPLPVYSNECGTCPYPSLCFGNLLKVRE